MKFCSSFNYILWSGYITENVLRKVLEENAFINNSEEYLSKDTTENNKAYSKKQGFSDIREMINRAFCDFQKYNYYQAGQYHKRRTPFVLWQEDCYSG